MAVRNNYIMYNHSINLSRDLFLLILIVVFMICNSDGKNRCPVKFEYRDEKCWYWRRRETYSEATANCRGNILSPRYYRPAIYMQKNDDYDLFWTYYTRAYTNGPLINSNLAYDISVNVTTDFVKIDSTTSDEMCSVFNFMSGGIQSANCNKKYRSICIIEPYNKTLQSTTCPSEYLLFKYPRVTCLKDVFSAKNEIKRTSSAVDALCSEDLGFTLQGGYIYTTYPKFQSQDRKAYSPYSTTPSFESDTIVAEYPIGIKRRGNGPYWPNMTKSTGYWEIPEGNWEDLNENSSVSLENGIFHIGDKYRNFTRMICEYTPNAIEMKLTVNRTLDLSSENLKYDEVLILEIFSELVEKGDFTCFTDAVTYYPTKVRVKSAYENNNKSSFIMDAKENGDYWCIGNDNSSYKLTKSNKILFLPNSTQIQTESAYLVQFPDNIDIGGMIEFINMEFKMPKFKRIFLNHSVLIHSALFLRDDHRFNVVYMRTLRSCAQCIPQFASSPCCEGDYITGYREKEYDTSTDASTTEESYIDGSGDFYSTTDVNDVDYTTALYDKQVQDVIDTLQSMLELPVEPDALETAVGKMNDVLLLKDVELPDTLAKGLEEVMNVVEIPPNETYIKVVQSNIAVLVAKRKGPEPVVGIQVRTIMDGRMTDDTVQPLTAGDLLNPELYESNSDIVVKVPSHICHGVSGQLSFGVYKDDSLFPKDNNGNWSVNSRVLSISLDNKTCFKNMDYVDIYFRPFDNHQSRRKKACAYWDFDNGNWTTNVCVLLPHEKMRPMDICRCYHMTHFAQIIGNEFFDIENDHHVILSSITYATCALSLIGLIIICMTSLISHTWRAEFSNKVWLNLSISIALLIVTFLSISVIDFTDQPLVCISTGVVLHFSVLSSFSWMFLSAFMSYKKIKKVFTTDAPYRLLKVCIIGWIVPMLPVAILLGVDCDTYLLHFKKGDKQMNFCYPSGYGFWITVFIPVACVVIANSILFCLIIYNIFKQSNITSHGDKKQIFRKVSVTFLMFFLYGLTWMFGLFSNNIYFAYIFCIAATAQGFVLFLFFIILNKKTRKIWCRFLGAKDTTLPSSSKRAKTKSSSNFEEHEVVKLTKYPSAAFD